MAQRNYSSVARAATLTASISGSATTAVVSETTGFPTVPFTLVIDPGRTAEEVVTVTAQVGLSLTLSRGQDGTTAVPHDAGATVRHMATARDFRDSAEHIEQTAGVHGVFGSVVGDIDVQNLDNKTFQAIGTDHTPVVVKANPSQTTPLLVFQEPGGNPVVSHTYIGSAGLLSTGQQTVQASVAAGVPLTVKGASGQSADLLRVSNSGGTTVARFDSVGKLYADVEGQNAVFENADIDQLTTEFGLFETPSTTQSAVAIRVPAATDIPPFTMRTSETAIARAGNNGPGGGWQFYHGGSIDNLIPFKTRVGSITANIQPGQSAIVVTADFTSSGFTQAPFVICSISTNETDPTARKVAVTHRTPTTTSCDFRVFISDGTAVSALGNYTVQYIAMQMTPTSSAG